VTINYLRDHGFLRSFRLRTILDDPEDFGLRGRYFSYYTSQRGDDQDSYDRDSSHQMVYITESNGTYSEVALGIRDWPHWKDSSQKPKESDFSSRSEYVNYVVSHPDYISVNPFDLDPLDTNYVDAADVIEWLQEQAEADGYRIVGIQPSDFDIDYDDYSNTGTWTSSSGGGDYVDEGIEWTIDFDPSNWRQVKL